VKAPQCLKTASNLASYTGLLAPAFVACSTSDKRWGEKAWL